MKRSLALGALMAFVITGSAWASVPVGWTELGELGSNMYVANDSNGEISDYTFTGPNDDVVMFYGKLCSDYVEATKSTVTIGNNVTIKPYLGLGIIAGCTNIDNDSVHDAINGDLSNNKVIVNDGNIEVIQIIGGYNNNNNGGKVTSNNIVEINGGTINITSNYIPGAGIIGGYKFSGGEVKENSVIVTGGTVTGDIYGGFHQANTDGDAIENSVDINGGNVVGNVYGGYSRKGANGNSVKVTGGTVTGNIYGSHSDFGESKNNSVNISGGIVIGNVYGGSIKYGEFADGNDVNISGKANVENANLFAARRFEAKPNDPNDFFAGVTWVEIGHKGNDNNLNITGWKGSESEAEKGYGTIGSAQNFNVINIIEGSSVSFKTALNDNDVVVNVKGATWNVDQANTVGSAYFDATSTLKIDGATFANNDGENSNYALNGNGTLTVEQGAKLTVEGIDNNTYNIAKGFENITEAKDKWVVTNLNALMQGTWTADKDKGLQLNVVAKEAGQLATEMGVSVSTAQSVADVTAAAQALKQEEGFVANPVGTGDAKAVAFVEAMSGVDSKVAGQVFEAVSKMAEAGGNSATAANIVKNVTGVTNDRLSFNCGHSAPHKGGHGVGLFEEGSGADIWVEYVHGKDKVEDMPSTAGTTSYEGQYNGIVMGVDFKKVNKFQSGIALNYGEGDTNSVGSAARTHSDYDFWGIGYYGNIHNDDSNVIFDIGYAKTDSDVENTNATGVNFKASPETTTWTAGVKVEKLYQNENVQIVPYTGLRFISIDPDDYSTECASSSYKMERQNVWLLPMGVSIRQEITNDNGWTVSPRVDLSYIWAFGDTDSDMEFSTLGTKTNIGYEVMDDGSFLGLVGIEAHKGQWGFGVSYSYQKGDHAESKKWYVDVNYSF